MANVLTGGPTFPIKGANAYYLGNAGQTFVSTWAVMIVNDASFVGSISVKSRIQGKEAADASVAPVPVVYVARYLNGSVGTDALVSTAITTTTLMIVPATGQNIVLDCTSYTSGSCSVYAFPYEGAA
jgi:hypothetical protein